MLRALAMIAVLSGCDRRAVITSCAVDLSGEYEGDGRRWMLIDHGPRVEAFPLFVDVPVAGELEVEVAPRVIEWRRSSSGALRGDARRRYMKASTSCIAKVPSKITACAADTLEVVHGDTAAPLSFEPCQFGRVEPARVERWTRR
jgi:hypothetical protein